MDKLRSPLTWNPPRIATELDVRPIFPCLSPAKNVDTVNDTMIPPSMSIIPSLIHIKLNPWSFWLNVPPSLGPHTTWGCFSPTPPAGHMHDHGRRSVPVETLLVPLRIAPDRQDGPTVTDQGRVAPGGCFFKVCGAGFSMQVRYMMILWCYDVFFMIKLIL